jgi:yecA family protein
MKYELPDFDVVADALKSAGLDSDTAECHGALSALLSTVEGLNAAHWLALYLTAEKAAELPADILAVLGTVFEATAEQIDNPEFGFNLLLPSDDSMLDVRVEAISNWCQGFLMGLGLAGVKDIESLPGDLSELVQDFIKISRADALALDDTEASENAFAEIVEYVRVGAMMFREEMKALNTDNQEKPQPLH